jgi:hypothetical protein
MQIIDRNDNWFEAERIGDVIPKTKLGSGLYVTGIIRMMGYLILTLIIN